MQHADTASPDVQNVDATTDTGAPSDVVQDSGLAADVATDTGADAATCTGTFDPRDFWYFKNTIAVARIDATLLGSTAENYVSKIEIAPGDPAAPDDMAGNCVYYATALTGSATRNAAPELNLGSITATSGAFHYSATYDSTMNLYAVDDSMAQPLTANFAFPLVVAGGPDGPAGMVTGNFPPILTVDMVTLPATFSRSTNTVVSWTPPTGPGSGPDLAGVLVATDRMFANTIICAVPACAGTATIPASLTAHYAAGMQTNFLVSFMRSIPVPPTTRQLNLVFQSSIQTRTTWP